MSRHSEREETGQLVCLLTLAAQIQGTGSYFQDMKNPKVMVQVGQPGDKGVLEIVEMLFSVKGPTAGAILMEWNVHESTQGSGN